MRNNTPTALLESHWRFVFVVGLVAAVLSVVISLFQPLEYRATSRLLITPFVSSSGEVFDQFTALKSAEQMGLTLSDVIHTTLFQNKVLQQPYDIKPNEFESEPRKRRKEWSKKVQPEIVKGTGVLAVSVFDIDKNRASELSHAISDELVLSGKEFLPGTVEMRIVDPPLLSRYPVRPNLLARALFGFLFGVFFAISYIYLHKHTKRHDEFNFLP